MSNQWLATIAAVQTLVLLVILARYLVQRYEIEIDTEALAKGALLVLAGALISGLIVYYAMKQAQRGGELPSPQAGVPARVGPPPRSAAPSPSAHLSPVEKHGQAPGTPSPRASTPAKGPEVSPGTSAGSPSPRAASSPGPAPSTTASPSPRADAAPKPAPPASASPAPAPIREKASPASPDAGKTPSAQAAPGSAPVLRHGKDRPAPAEPKPPPSLTVTPSAQVKAIVDSSAGRELSALWNTITSFAEDRTTRDVSEIMRLPATSLERQKVVRRIEAQRKSYLKLRPRLASALRDLKALIYRGAITVGAYHALEALINERYFYLVFKKYTYPQSTEFSDLRLEMHISLLSLEKQYLGLIALFREDRLTQEVVDGEREFFANEIDFLLRARSLVLNLEGSPDAKTALPMAKRVKFARDNEQVMEELVRSHRQSAELVERKEAKKLRNEAGNADYGTAFETILELCRINADKTKPPRPGRS